MEEEKNCIIDLSIDRTGEEFWVNFRGLDQHIRFGPFSTQSDAELWYNYAMEVGKKLGAEEIPAIPFATGALH